MIVNEILDNVRTITYPARWQRGSSYYRNHYVYDVGFRIKDGSVIIGGQVEGSISYQSYQSELTIDLKDLKVKESYCTCQDYKDNERRHNGLFICKHIVATLLECTGIITERKQEHKLNYIHEQMNFMEKVSPEDIILSDIESDKEKVNLEVYMDVNTEDPNCRVEFKIGQEKMYVLKSLNDFAVANSKKEEIKYGKSFTYNPRKHVFVGEDENIVSFIDEMVAIGEQLSVVPKYRRKIDFVDGKTINIMGSYAKRFFDILGNKSISLKLNNSEYSPKILHEDLPLSFNIKENDQDILLTTDEEIPEALSAKGDVFFYKQNIYLPSSSQCNSYKYFYKYLKEDKQVKFSKNRFSEVIQKVLPVLNEASENVSIDDKITKKIRNDLETEFYLDRDRNSVYINLVFKYNNNNDTTKETEKDINKNENNKEEFYIVRDIKKENHIKSVLRELKFAESNNNKYLFEGTEADLYELLSENIKVLKSLGSVYYTDKFKYNIQNASVSISINKNKDKHFLDINFAIEDVDKKEYKAILKSFKENKRFHKLKNDTILDLDNKDFKEAFELLDNVVGDIHRDIDIDSIKLNNNRAIYLNETIKDKNFKFISGKEYLKEIAEKIDTINEVSCEIPKNLKADLRNYQVEGFKWLKTLAHLEFGGILADEMGLGKTIQTICFLLSEKNKKSLIVTPTSLIYNWKDEFENFAPDMKILILHGEREHRIELFEKIDDYDVVLTTYSTLRNDYEYYNEKYFDYMVIDEGQNIKNPHTKNTHCIKGINAGVKFVLTGTPIENNLMELWSIFDFFMPGYLFNKTTFEKKFIKGKEENLLELKKMITPFILRRLKKDVLKELPDKIEKKFFVEMDKEQKKVYTALVNDINEKREDEEFRKDKITIFSYLTKLRQLCLDPSIIVDNYKGKSAKIDVCLELIEDAIKNNHKILLFSQFTTVLGSLKSRLEENNIGYYYLDGSTNANKRVDLVNEFNQKDDKKVFLISLKAGGTGLNLTSADIVIHFDPWWNPAIEDQATDRAHRFGQKNIVEVIKLIAKGTVEEKIVKLQDDKKELIANIMDENMKNSSLLNNLSEEDINELFTLY